MSLATGLKEAIRLKSLTALTKTIGELADKLGYELRPPYTEIMQFKAREECDLFAVQFTAKLHLHYSSLGREKEGLVFTIQFSGESLADSPTPPIDELFYAAAVQSMFIYGHGSRWEGKTVTLSDEVARNLELNSEKVVEIEIEDFYRMLEEKS